MRLVWCFIFGSGLIVFSLVMLFEVVRVNDVFKYCEANNLVLIDEMCTEDLLNYGVNLFIGGLILGAAGMLLIVSVMVAPDLPSFGYRDQGMKI